MTSLVEEINGWYKENKTKTMTPRYSKKTHYFYKSKISLCGLVSDPAVILIPCSVIERRKCKICQKVLQTYGDLDNIPTTAERRDW